MREDEGVRVDEGVERQEVAASRANPLASASEKCSVPCCAVRYRTANVSPHVSSHACRPRLAI